MTKKLLVTIAGPCGSGKSHLTELFRYILNVACVPFQGGSTDKREFGLKDLADGLRTIDVEVVFDERQTLSALKPTDLVVIDYAELGSAEFNIQPVGRGIPIYEQLLLYWKDAEGRTQIMHMPKSAALSLLSTLSHWKSHHAL